MDSKYSMSSCVKKKDNHMNFLFYFRIEKIWQRWLESCFPLDLEDKDDVLFLFISPTLSPVLVSEKVNIHSNEYLDFLFFHFFYCCSSTVVSISPRPLPPTPAIPTSHPWSYPTLVLSMWPLHMFLTNLPPPPHYPLLSPLLLLSVCSLHNGILHRRKKEGAPTLCDSMDGTGEHYAKWNKPGGERQIPYDLTYKWNLINKTSKQAKCNQRHWN